MKKSGYTKLVELDITDRTAGGAQLGDVILYDWDGRPDSKIDHVAIVTSIGPDGTVGISQHTPARSYRQWNLNSNGAQLSAHALTCCKSCCRSPRAAST